MTIFDVERVIIKYLNDNGTFSAISHIGNKIYNNCVFVTSNPDIITYDTIGMHALLISVDNQNFIVGYYIDEYETSTDKIYLEGEKMIRYGSSMGIIMGDSGYIGIYEFKRNADGTIKKTPKLEYNAKSEIYASFTKMLSTMADSSASMAIVKDIMGNNDANFKMKGHGLDKGNRFDFDVKGTPAGMAMYMSLDTGLGPLRSIPLIPIKDLPDNLTFESSFTVPLQLMYTLLGVTNTSIAIDKKGVMTLKTGPMGTGPSIVLDPVLPGSIVIKNNAAGTGTITIGKTGSIVIDGVAGVEVKGAKIGLLATLIEFMTDYQTHLHPSAMGPTGVPFPPAGVVATTKLNTIKGMN